GRWMSILTTTAREWAARLPGKRGEFAGAGRLLPRPRDGNLSESTGSPGTIRPMVASTGCASGRSGEARGGGSSLSIQEVREGHEAKAMDVRAHGGSDDGFARGSAERAGELAAMGVGETVLLQTAVAEAQPMPAMREEFESFSPYVLL